MARILAFICFIAASGYIMVLGLEMVPERAQMVYYNLEFFNYVTLSIRRAGRGQPYAIGLHYHNLVFFGNNVTTTMQVFEQMSTGQYNPTPLIMRFNLCEFYEKEPFLGQMFKKQMNITCPIPPGEYHYPAVTVNLASFPYFVPFAWTHQVSVHTRVDCSAHFTDSKEIIYNASIYFTITQKPKMKKT